MHSWSILPGTRRQFAGSAGEIAEIAYARLPAPPTSLAPDIARMIGSRPSGRFGAEEKPGERTMSILDRLFGISLAEDVTETAWWTDSVFRRLERGLSDEAASDAEVSIESSRAASELI
jgi:hypothetical protein